MSIPPSAVPGWDRYGDTVIRFRRGGRAVDLDLREEIPARTLDALVNLGLRLPFAVVTACRPIETAGGLTGERAAGRERGRTAWLARSLRAAGIRPIRADGGSPDGTHVEPGWSFPSSPAEAVRWGRRCDQAAVFHVDVGGASVLPALVDADPRPLPESRS